MAEDLVSACGLVLDQTKKKKIKSVDGNRVPCSGSTSFQAMYGGETTNVLALFTPALNKEVILSWRTLQRLRVISKDFPSPVPLHDKAATYKAEKKQSNLVKPEEAINLNETIEELMDQYQELFKTNDLDQLNPIPHEVWDDVVTRAGANLTPA